MRQTKTRAFAENKPLGVIDVVSAGLDLVRRRPWTLLVPILFDVLIWVLPRLSLASLFRPAGDMLSTFVLSSAPDAATDSSLAIQPPFETLHLLGAVSSVLAGITRLPTLLGITSVDVHSPFTSLAYTAQLESPLLAIVLFVPLFLLGLFAVALYLESIAQGVRPLETSTRGAGLLRAARLWLRLIFFALLLVGIVFVVAIVISLIQAIFGSADFAGLVFLIASVGLFWLFIYLFFVPSALAVSDIGVRESLRRSALLFRVFFWPTLALVGLSLFLDYGLRIIWEGLTVSSFGVAVAIIGNAFIGTALIAASMVYYQDRFNVFERIRAATKLVKK